MQRRFSDRSIRSRLARASLLVCAIALGSIAVACGNEEPGAPEPAASPAEPTQPAPESAPSAAATPDPAEPIMTEGAIPEGFPSDIPVYPGATIGPSMSVPGEGVFATFATDDAVDAILTHYRSELAKNGWSVVDTAERDGIDGTKGGRKVELRVRPNEENRTDIAISLSGS